MEEFLYFCKMETINLIVAAGRDGAIGRKGDLIWHIAADLRRFKTLTLGHPVIMGRKTWESLPKRPLPGRLNIVMTRNPDYKAPGAEVVGSPEEALEAVRSRQENELGPKEGGSGSDGSPFIIGGEELYRTFMPFATRIYLTEVEDTCEDADAHLPLPLDSSLWKVMDIGEYAVTPDGVTYRYVTYERG